MKEENKRKWNEAKKLLRVVGTINSLLRIPFMFENGKFKLDKLLSSFNMAAKYVAPVTEEVAKHYAKKKGMLGIYVLYQNIYEFIYYVLCNIWIYKTKPLVKARLAAAAMHQTTVLLHKLHLGALASILHFIWNKSGVDHKGFLVEWGIDLTEADKRDRK